MSEKQPNGLKLLVILCVVLVIAWAVFLIIAPEPGTTVQPYGGAASETRPERNTLFFVFDPFDVLVQQSHIVRYGPLPG
jgi:uncharacterized membrane protein